MLGLFEIRKTRQELEEAYALNQRIMKECSALMHSNNGYLETINAYLDAPRGDKKKLRADINKINETYLKELDV